MAGMKMKNAAVALRDDVRQFEAFNAAFEREHGPLSDGSDV